MCNSYKDWLITTKTSAKTRKKKHAHAKWSEKKRKTNRVVSSLLYRHKAHKAATFSRQPALSYATPLTSAQLPSVLPGFFFHRPSLCGFRSSYFSLLFRFPLVIKCTINIHDGACRSIENPSVKLFVIKMTMLLRNPVKIGIENNLALVRSHDNEVTATELNKSAITLLSFKNMPQHQH